MKPPSGLVVGRKVGENIVLRVDGKVLIRIHLARCSSQKAGILIEADKAISIAREELDRVAHPEDYDAPEK